jgi:hypothetical protein
MCLRDRVIQQLIQTYKNEYGIPVGGVSALNEVAKRTTSHLNWYRAEEFGSSDFYDLYSDLLNELSPRSEKIRCVSLTR